MLCVFVTLAVDRCRPGVIPASVKNNIIYLLLLLLLCRRRDEKCYSPRFDRFSNRNDNRVYRRRVVLLLTPTPSNTNPPPHPPLIHVRPEPRNISLHHSPVSDLYIIIRVSTFRRLNGYNKCLYYY